VTNFLRGLAQLIFVVGVLVAIFVGGAVALAIAHFSRDLPDHQQLLTYQSGDRNSKVYAGDGSLAEFATEHRIITPLNQIPPVVVHAFLAAEDRDFYNHNGVNPLGGRARRGSPTSCATDTASGRSAPRRSPSSSSAISC
jgi:penicillin-binding protein 1A